jgi:acyl-ACP thioesterase
LKDYHTYRQNFTIRSSEVSPEGKAKLQSICDLLQETAGNHALELNFDVSQLRQKNLTWMLHRLHVKMNSFPEWRDHISIKTWPSSGDTLRAYRDFLIEDSEGNNLGRCLSYWLMINTDTKKPIRMPEEVLRMAPSNSKHVLEIKKNRIEVNQKIEGSKTFKVRRSDLDVNQHVNNVKYIEWALEALPSDKWVNEIDIEFRAECTEHEEVKSGYATSSDKNSYLHKIVRTSDGKVVATARSKS